MTRYASVTGGVAVALALLLLAPSLALLVPPCAANAGEAGHDDAPMRCPGLWSSDCCDFVAPSPTVQISSSRLSSTAPPPATAVRMTVESGTPSPLVASLDASRDVGSGSARTALLESTVLLL